jgi:pimeloyl-ACP methyl ester carboxylesterase
MRSLSTSFDLITRIAALLVVTLCAVLVGAGCNQPEFSASVASEADVENREPISVQTSDGHVVYGYLHRPTELSGATPDSSRKKFPLILAFHQGGSSGEAEYAPIIPRLQDEGFGVLTIDQRRGGNRFMGSNRTAADFDQDAISYCDAMEDLEAAFSYAVGIEDVDTIIAWGSSYSATLAVQLGARHPELISKVLAFSPASGDPMAGCNPLSAAFGLRQPALFLRPKSEMSFGSVTADMEAYLNMGHQTYIASPGAHGSSMLVSSRVDGETTQTWNTVLDFLRDYKQ